jgi:RNA polymerase sigma-70 factor, ECF subfamily
MTTLSVTAALTAEEPLSLGEPGVLPSFRSIYELYFDFVWSCTRRMGVPMDAADDVVQEVFLVVHARIKTLERPASLRSWIYGVVRRTVSTYHRDRRTRDARDSIALFEEGLSTLQPSALDLASLSEDVRLLWRLLERLHPRKREVLVLAELEEMTVPEIAEAIGVPLNTAYSRLRVARHEFQEAFARHDRLAERVAR